MDRTARQVVHAGRIRRGAIGGGVEAVDFFRRHR
jgi:hypothetical protein